MLMKPSDPGISALIEALEKRDRAGMSPRNRVELAEALGISKQWLFNWKKVPAHYVLEIENMIKLSRHVMRPDVFGPPKATKGLRRVRRRASD